MRRMITGKLIEWIKSLKEKVVQNGNTTEVGGNLEVDGNIKASGGENVYPLVDGFPFTSLIEGLDINFQLSKKIGDIWFIQIKCTNNTGEALANGTEILKCDYKPSSTIYIPATFYGTINKIEFLSTGRIKLGSILNNEYPLAFSYIIKIQ